MNGDIYLNGVVTRAVLDLLPGDRVDLQNDLFADPDGHTGGESPAALECEFQTVESVVRETPDCVCVYFEGFDAVGFPVDHRVEVDGEQTPDERVANAAEAGVVDSGGSLALDRALAARTVAGESE